MSIETICIFYELTTNKRIINKLSASEHTLPKSPNQTAETPQLRSCGKTTGHILAYLFLPASAVLFDLYNL